MRMTDKWKPTLRQRLLQRWQRVTSWAKHFGDFQLNTVGDWWYMAVKQFMPRRLQNAYWWIVHRTWDRYDRIYIPTLKPGYHDKPEIMLHGVMALIVDFVERENAGEVIDWSSTPEHQAAWDEICAMYLWWTAARPNRRDPLDEIESPDWGSEPVMFDENGLPTLYRLVQKYESEEHRTAYLEAIHASASAEELWAAEDTEMLVRAIMVRPFLWT